MGTERKRTWNTDTLDSCSAPERSQASTGIDWTTGNISYSFRRKYCVCNRNAIAGICFPSICIFSGKKIDYPSVRIRWAVFSMTVTNALTANTDVSDRVEILQKNTAHIYPQRQARATPRLPKCPTFCEHEGRWWRIVDGARPWWTWTVLGLGGNFWISYPNINQARGGGLWEKGNGPPHWATLDPLQK